MVTVAAERLQLQCSITSASCQDGASWEWRVDKNNPSCFVMEHGSNLDFFCVSAPVHQEAKQSFTKTTWAARCSTRLLIKMTPKGVVFSFLLY